MGSAAESQGARPFCYNGFTTMNQPPEKMLTVGEINSTFAEKGIQVQLPLPAAFLVRSLQILERKKIPGGVALLLSVRFVNDKGEEVSDLFHCEGAVESEEKKRWLAAVWQSWLSSRLPRMRIPGEPGF